MGFHNAQGFFRMYVDEFVIHGIKHSCRLSWMQDTTWCEPIAASALTVNGARSSMTKLIITLRRVYIAFICSFSGTKLPNVIKELTFVGIDSHWIAMIHGTILDLAAFGRTKMCMTFAMT